MLPRLCRTCRRFVRGEDGPTAVEYAVLLALIITVCIASITTLGGSVSGAFGAVTAVFGGSAPASSGVVANTQVGGAYQGGSSVTGGGTFTVPWGTDQTGTYNAATGALTITSPDGSSASSQQNAGVLPNIKSGYVWTRTE